MRMVSSSSTVLSGRSQPSGTGRVTPLSWSTSTVGSAAAGEPSGDGLSPGASSVPVPGGCGAEVPERVVVGEASSSLPSSTAPVTTVPTTTAPAATSAMVLAPLPPPPVPPARPGPDCWGTVAYERVWAVHAAPSHHRSPPGADVSGYQPGGVALLIAPL